MCTETPEKHNTFFLGKSTHQVWYRHRLQVRRVLTQWNKRQEMNPR